MVLIIAPTDKDEAKRLLEPRILAKKPETKNGRIGEVVEQEGQQMIPIYTDNKTYYLPLDDCSMPDNYKPIKGDLVELVIEEDKICQVYFERK